MKIKKLIKILKQSDQNDDVQIYILENGGDLVHGYIESILNTEIGCELTVEKERQKLINNILSVAQVPGPRDKYHNIQWPPSKILKHNIQWFVS